MEDAVCAVFMSCDGTYMLTQESNGTVRSWLVDWELAENAVVEWHEDARSLLACILYEHIHYGSPLPQGKAAGDLQGGLKSPLNLKYFKDSLEKACHKSRRSTFSSSCSP